jgi:hypothetical protein
MLQAASAPMVPAQVAAGIKALLSKAEQSAGLPVGSGTDEDRLIAILKTDQPMDPDLYEVIHGGGGE